MEVESNDRVILAAGGEAAVKFGHERVDIRCQTLLPVELPGRGQGSSRRRLGTASGEFANDGGSLAIAAAAAKRLSSSAMDSTGANKWATEWLDAVADGSNAMSQRKLSSVVKRGGGIDAIKAIAAKKGVHLLLLEDDKGNELVAASTKPFKVIC